MYAVIETGGKQYRVEKGDLLRVERLDKEVGDTIEFDRVLIIGDGKNVKIGKPYLSETVTAKLLENAKADKVIVYKYKAKKNYRKKQGHRQPFSLIEIKSIGGASKTEKTVPVEKETAADENKVNTVAKKKTDIKLSMSMKKDELLNVAEENGIKVDSKLKKQEIIDKINESLK